MLQLTEYQALQELTKILLLSLKKKRNVVLFHCIIHQEALYDKSFPKVFRGNGLRDKNCRQNLSKRSESQKPSWIAAGSRQRIFWSDFKQRRLAFPGTGTKNIFKLSGWKEQSFPNWHPTSGHRSFTLRQMSHKIWTVLIKKLQRKGYTAFASSRRACFRGSFPKFSPPKKQLCYLPFKHSKLM